MDCPLHGRVIVVLGQERLLVTRALFSETKARRHGGGGGGEGGGEGEGGWIQLLVDLLHVAISFHGSDDV